ncbi:putative mitochondrial carrier domain protein [Helianthus annuus]|nr:hypothetical protein HanIR_Chr12g0564911 [Helianthus annuus]KAJ0503967.1 putative mitochondrial phosphate carrier protein Pic2/Mir1 [Helianthus annuus]KAJ0861310.1 putative mitochondrial carrier domain protein [Helianthus annuus]
MFVSFETIVKMFNKYAIPIPKNECCLSFQLGVSFASGYVTGKLGIRGLFTRELALLILMIGTLTGAQWGIYYVFNVFIGLLSSPL